MIGETDVMILNVDDDEVGRYAKSRLLSHAGYTVLEAATGTEALRLAGQQPRLVVLDVNLPDLSGIEICHQLKTEPATAVIPILLISATYVDSHWYAAGLESGADGYLTEPVEPVVFLATVRALLRAHEAEAALRQARDELELRVAKRTAALDEANRALQAEILERERAEADARRQAAQAEALARVARSFNAQLEQSQVLEIVCRETARLLNVSAAAVVLYDESRQTYSFAAGHGLPPDFLEQAGPVSMATYELSRPRSEPIWMIADVQQRPDLVNAALYAKTDVRTIAGVNMERGGRTIGTLLALMIGESRTFDDQELDLMKGVADQAALALANAGLFKEVRTGQERLRRMAQRLVSVQEEERRRLSRELHDSAGQSLTALQLNLSLVGESLSVHDSDVRQGIDEVLQLARMAYEEIRAVSHALRPPALDTVGLDQALASLCRDFARHATLTIDYQGVELPPLPDTVAVSYYRFLQEGLTNVAKHANADQVCVRLNYDDGVLSLVVEDNGVGLPPATAYSTGKPGHGMGLVGMRERFELLGGALQIESQPGEGTRLVGRCPVRLD